jgi:hypothetical protein
MNNLSLSPYPSRYLRIALGIGMMICVAYGISFLFESLQPNLAIQYFVPTAILVALAGFFENSILIKEISNRDGTVFRIAGFIVLAIITKGLTYTGTDLTTILNDIRGWGDRFFEEFFQMQFIFIYGSFLIIWFLSHSYASDFQLIENSVFSTFLAI